MGDSLNRLLAGSRRLADVKEHWALVSPAYRGCRAGAVAAKRSLFILKCIANRRVVQNPALPLSVVIPPSLEKSDLRRKKPRLGRILQS
jgi:hypothetical protein